MLLYKLDIWLAALQRKRVYLSSSESGSQVTTDRVWWPDEGSSRCSGSSSPSSCLACTGSHVRGWTTGRTRRWHTGSWHRGPASCCRCPPHTGAESADGDCTPRRSSTSPRPPGSLCRPGSPPTGLQGRHQSTTGSDKRSGDPNPGVRLLNETGS